LKAKQGQGLINRARKELLACAMHVPTNEKGHHAVEVYGPFSDTTKWVVSWLLLNHLREENCK